MNKPVSPGAVIRGEEHWTNKGATSGCSSGRSMPAIRPGPAGTILFVHGSSMASQPTFDLQVPGRPDSSVMDYFAARGFDTWCVDMEGYGRSTKDRDINSPSRTAPTTASRPPPTSRRLRGKRPAPGLRHFLGRAARRAVRAAPSRDGGAARLDAMVWTGEGSRRWPSAARGCPNSAPRTAGRSTAPSCARSSSATIPAPPTTM